MILLLLAQAWAADCPENTSKRAVSDLVMAAEGQLASLEIEGFRSVMKSLDASLVCLTEPADYLLAASVHRLKGMEAFGNRSPNAERYFAAARSIDPTYEFPETLIPAGNPMRDAYAAFDTSLGGYVGVELPAGADGDLRMDGFAGDARPTDWPTLIQYVTPEGEIALTRWLTSEQALPAWPAPKPVVVPEPKPEPQPAQPVPMPQPQPVAPVDVQPVTQRSARVPLWIAAGTAAVATGVVYGMAGATKATWLDQTTPDADLPDLRSRANSLALGSGFGAGATVSLAIAASVVPGKKEKATE